MTGFGNGRQTFVQIKAALATEFAMTVNERRAQPQRVVGLRMAEAAPRPLAVGDCGFDYPAPDAEVAFFFVDNFVFGPAHLAALGAPRRVSCRSPSLGKR